MKTIKAIVASGMLSLILAACGHANGPSDEDVINAFSVYLANSEPAAIGLSTDEVRAKVKKVTTIKGCSADESHSTSTSRAYQCKLGRKDSSQEAVAHMLLESGQWRVTSVDG